MPAPAKFKLGGISVSLSPDISEGEFDLVGEAGQFSIEEVPQFQYPVSCGWFPNISSAVVKFETVQGWQLLNFKEKTILKTCSVYEDPRVLGVFSHDFQEGAFYVAKSFGKQNAFYFPLARPMGELFFMNLLGGHLGIIFHACGVTYLGRGFLFTGHGGIGKTTTARLWQKVPGALILNDDKVIVRKDDQGYLVHGTPWHGVGGMASPDFAPLDGIFILKQSPVNQLNKLSSSETVARLLARTFSPLWDDLRMANTLEYLEGIVGRVPCFEYNFKPDHTSVEYIQKMILKGL